MLGFVPKSCVTTMPLKTKILIEIVDKNCVVILSADWYQAFENY